MTNTNDSIGEMNRAVVDVVRSAAEEGGEWTDEKIAALCEEAAKGEWSASSLQWKIDDIISRTRKEAEAEAWKAAVEAVPPAPTGMGLRLDDYDRGWNLARQQLIQAAKDSGVNLEV